MKNYLELNEIGVIEGVKVQCLPVDKNKCVYLKYEICTSNGCPFQTTPCLIPCTSSERQDKANVYFKKVE